MGRAGGLPRRLGIGVVPAPGESFPSWVDRMAVRMRTGPGWIIREMGVELLPGGKSVVQAANYGISMSPGEPTSRRQPVDLSMSRTRASTSLWSPQTGT
jgi:hypothetical protein